MVMRLDDEFGLDEWLRPQGRVNAIGDPRDLDDPMGGVTPIPNYDPSEPSDAVNLNSTAPATETDPQLAARQQEFEAWKKARQQPIDAVPENKDNGARPANAPDTIKQAAQAKAGGPAFNAQDFLKNTPEDEAEVLAYKNALGQARQGRMAADIGQIGADFSDRLLGTKSSGDFWERQRAEAQGPLETLRALSGVKAGQDARKKAGLAQGLAFQTAQTNALNALTAQQNAADSKRYRDLQARVLEGKLAGQDASSDAIAALGKADSPETAALKEMFKKAQPEAYARLVAEKRWDTITGAELGDPKEIGKTYRAILSGEASGQRQGAAFTQESIRNARETREKLEEETRKAAAKAKEEAEKNRIVDMVQIPDAPQLSETETKDLRNRKAATENLNRQLDRAKQLLHDHGLKVLAPGTQGYSLWNSMKGQLKSAYKEQKALGSLDDGVERLVQDITGGTLDIASGNMPGLIEENVAVNRADFETLARNKGWVYPSAKPAAPPPPVLPKGVTLPPEAQMGKKAGTVKMYPPGATQPVAVPFDKIGEAISDLHMTYRPTGGK